MNTYVIYVREFEVVHCQYHITLLTNHVMNKWRKKVNESHDIEIM